MRLLVRLVAALLGLLAVVAGVVLAVEAGWAWFRPESSGLMAPWQRLQGPLDRVSWSDPRVMIVAGVLALVGLLLLLVAARAGRKDIRLHDPAPEVTVTTDRRSLARLVGHHVRDQDGVAHASVTATRSRVRVKATGEFSSVGDLRSRLTTVTEETVKDLPLRTRPTISISAAPAKQQR